jgi:hypothetical protein
MTRGKSAKGFKLRDVSFDGDGLRAQIRDIPWERLRELSYQTREVTPR